MRKLLVFQHVPYEILGTFDPLLRAAGFRIRYLNFVRNPSPKINIQNYNGIIVLGGPMNVDETNQYPHLLCELKLLDEALKAQIPIFGICLGAQLTAKVLGAKVTKNPRKEIGWYNVFPTPQAKTDPLFSHLKPVQKVFQWHGDTFDIPKGAQHLATTNTCENQAFRYGDNVYGLQFHLEVDTKLIQQWLKRPAYIQEIQQNTDTTPNIIESETFSHIQNSQILSNAIFNEFITLLGFKKKFSHASSK